MAAPSLLLTSSDNDHDHVHVPMPMNPTPRGYEPQAGGRPATTSKPKPKRATKPPAQKRPPQRGPGVEQLERLRQQEQWKKLAETPHQQQLLRGSSSGFQSLLDHQHPHPHPHPQRPITPSPHAGTPVNFCQPGCSSSEVSGPGAFMYSGAGQLVTPGPGPGRSNTYGCFPYVFDQVPGSFAGIGSTSSATSRELSSIPNARCDMCSYKQKNVGSSVRNLGVFDHGVGDHHYINNSEGTVMDSRNFLSLKTGGTLGFGGSNVSSREDCNPAFHGNRQATHMDGEVMGVGSNKVVNAIGGGFVGNPLVEYDFFPGKSSNGNGNRSGFSKKLWFPSSEGQGDYYDYQILHQHQELEAPYPQPPACPDSVFAAVRHRSSSGGISEASSSRDPNSIDLSLRLSY